MYGGLILYDDRLIKAGVARKKRIRQHSRAGTEFQRQTCVNWRIADSFYSTTAKLSPIDFRLLWRNAVTRRRMSGYDLFMSEAIRHLMGIPDDWPEQLRRDLLKDLRPSVSGGWATACHQRPPKPPPNPWIYMGAASCFDPPYTYRVYAEIYRRNNFYEKANPPYDLYVQNPYTGIWAWFGNFKFTHLLDLPWCGIAINFKFEIPGLSYDPALKQHYAYAKAQCPCPCVGIENESFTNTFPPPFYWRYFSFTADWKDGFEGADVLLKWQYSWKQWDIWNYGPFRYLNYPDPIQCDDMVPGVATACCIEVWLQGADACPYHEKFCWP